MGSESVGQDILISGRVTMNRSIEGDVVAVELLPQEQWRGATSRVGGSREAEAGDVDAAAEGEEHEGGHIAQVGTFYIEDTNWEAPEEYIGFKCS